MTSLVGSGTEIYFYNHSGVLQKVLTGWEYVEYTQRVSSPWNHVIRMEMSYLDDMATFIRNTVVRDWIVEIYRSDEITGIKQLVYEGLHRTCVEQVRQSGTIIFTMYGVGYTDLLNRRIVIPPVGQGNLTFSGVAETVLKSFVSSQIVAPTDTARIFPGFSIESDAGQGSVTEYHARYTSLMTVCTDVAGTGGVDFGVIGNGIPATFKFRVLPLWGSDKRQGNTAGNPPMVFDLALHNMDIPIHSLSANDEVNHIYIGGQGQDVARTIIEMSSGAESVSPWNRIEAFVDARQESSASGLTTIGQQYLNKYAVIDTLSFNIIQNDGTRWLRDWVLGDIITAKYYDLSFSKKLTKITVTLSAGASGSSQNEVISVEMEEV